MVCRRRVTIAFNRQSVALIAVEKAKMAESGLLSAGDPLPLAQAVQGNLRTGPGGHAGPLYGRTEHGRFRGARH